MNVAVEFVSNPAVLEMLGLTADDLLDYEVTDVVPSKVTGATHIYLRQTLYGIPVYNGQLHVNVNRDGRIISVNNSFVPDLAPSVTALAPRSVWARPCRARRAISAGASTSSPAR